MKLPIEVWLDNQNLNSNIKELFKEGIICYKASAYRAALLFSFLGFQSEIKDRILRAEKPDNINPHAWENIKKNLRKEDGWDNEVNECIKKSDDQKRIFTITEDLRQQALFWKYRRNDCAHSKPNIIEHSHVEAFWSFLYSNLSKFVVNGSMESLLGKIRRHFDKNYTSEEADFSYLIKEIPTSISTPDMETFLQELDRVLKEFRFYGYIPEREINFWDQLINLGSPITEIATEFLKGQTDDSLLLKIIDRNPKNMLYFYGSDPEGVRNLWRTKHSRSEINIYSMLDTLLRNNLISEIDKNEAFEHIINNSDKLDADMDGDTFTCLNENGFFKTLKGRLFGEFSLINNFEWGNKNRDIVIKYIISFGLDNEIVSCINDTFSSQNHAYKLKDSLTYFLSSSPLKESYIEICTQLNITPTGNLGF
ncbi:hypothetical protein Q8G28_17725 [Lysinibacillus capsici]|uniref:hypothetical protein n=1 Tax=Lysinibacillus capsici TaxID=2115968 RepID=UPI00272FF15F|nr:hypothetical protein [Lysinibacillus capsici]MDP1395271.1 hypothetical protein [Lysinibacillus capsici]MDP1415736.1 hypothetical protein [Lysinibacillus capsici]MDP1431584.1 hypothetical protein [Lysinibacillus capsici]